MIFPEAAGAHTKTLSLLEYNMLKVWVWIGLKTFNPCAAYNFSASGQRKAVKGNGCKSSSSVWGGYLSGKIRCRKDTGSKVCALIHLSETTRMKYLSYCSSTSLKFTLAHLTRSHMYGIPSYFLRSMTWKNIPMWLIWHSNDQNVLHNVAPIGSLLTFGSRCWGGKGSVMGTVKFKVCSSSAPLSCKTNISYQPNV